MFFLKCYDKIKSKFLRMLTYKMSDFPASIEAH